MSLNQCRLCAHPLPRHVAQGEGQCLDCSCEGWVPPVSEGFGGRVPGPGRLLAPDRMHMFRSDPSTREIKLTADTPEPDCTDAVLTMWWFGLHRVYLRCADAEGWHTREGSQGLSWADLIAQWSPVEFGKARWFLTDLTGLAPTETTDQ